MAEENPSPGETMRRVGFGGGLAIGMGVGVALGVALDNMAVGIGLGISIGTVFMISFAAAGSRLAQGPRPEDGDTDAGADPDGGQES